MAQRVTAVTITIPTSTVMPALGPGMTQNLIATCTVMDGDTVITSGITIDTTVTFVRATQTGGNAATFTCPAGVESPSWFEVTAVANWNSSSVVDVSGSAVTWDSGDDFSAWAAGGSVAINGGEYLITSSNGSNAATISPGIPGPPITN